MERVVTFTGPPPAWEALHHEISASGLQVAIRMIDGLPAFPDETPADGWKEVRVSLAGEMITLRLAPGRLAVVVWGNANENQRRDWEQLAQACARATKGTVLETEN